jgi:hypothetical protein
MQEYAILNLDFALREIRQLDPQWVQSLIDVSNPKANYIRPLIQDPEPQYDPDTQQLLFGGYVVEQNQVRKTWLVYNFTPEEIAERNRKVWTAYEFLLRLTAEERATIRSMAQTDVGVADFLHLSQAAQEVISDDPVTLMGMNYLVSLGIFTEERKNQILGLV